MKSNEFIKNQIKIKGDFGLCPPPTTSEEALEVLKNHFLGEQWYSHMTASKEQINTEIVAKILEKNQSKKWYQRLFNY